MSTGELIKREDENVSENERDFNLAQRKAKAYAASTLVPKDFQNNMPNCLIAMNMAARTGADVMMVMQNLYVVHGKPGWSSQFLIATFNTCGRFSAMRFEFCGTKGKPDYGCRAWAVEKETGEKLFGAWITLELANQEGWLSKNGSKWKTMPEQMLMYRASAFFVRVYAPEISMGLHTAEELSDISGGDTNGPRIVSDQNKELADLLKPATVENEEIVDTETEESAMQTI